MINETLISDVSALLSTNIYTLNTNYLNSSSLTLSNLFINDESYQFFRKLEIDQPQVVLIYKKYYLGLIPYGDYNILIGPLLMNTTLNANYQYFKEDNNNFKIEKNTDIKTLLYSMTIINNSINDRQCDFETIFKISFSDSSLSNEVKISATSTISSNIDNGTTHHSFDRVKKLEDCVERGDLNAIYDSCLENMQQGNGTISKDEIKNTRALAIVGISIVTRAAINAGIDYEIAYSLSDSFLSKIEQANMVNSISSYYVQGTIEFTRLVNNLLNEQTENNENYYSKKAKDYITKNITTVNVVDLAKYLNVSPNYLSKMFKEGEGKTISTYILEKKIYFAKQMLSYLHLSEIEITYKLGFSSQSHFCAVFKKIEGITPKKYLELVDKSNE